MTPEEIKAAEDAKIQAELASDSLAKLQAEVAKLSEERDNYKNVALKRLGKLPGDQNFINETNDEGEMSVAEQVRIQLLDREIERNKAAEKAEVERIRRENAELKLALKNKSGGSLGGDSGASTEVKDNVLSRDQEAALRARATKLRLDPDNFVARAKENLQKR